MEITFVIIKQRTNTFIMRFSIFIFLLICSFFTFGCSSTDNCTKTITIPELIIISPSGSSYNPAYTQQVPCDYIVTPVTENTIELKNFSYEVLNLLPTQGKIPLDYNLKSS